MFIKTSAIILPLALGVIGNLNRPQNHLSAIEDGFCAKGVHIVGVRGTLELPGFGALQAIADELEKQIPESTQYAIDYPATGITLNPDNTTNPNLFVYSSSESQGYGALKQYLELYYRLCPSTKIVLLGYSQGAHVVGDALCGSYGIIFPWKSPIAEAIKENSIVPANSGSFTIADPSVVRAIIQLGDPTNRHDIEWHVGNSTHDGLFPRVSFKKCRDVTDRWQSYCDADDTFCDKGQSIPVHLGYVPEYGAEIVKFVVDKVQSSSSKFWDYRVKNDDL